MLLWNYLKINLKGTLEYKASFVMMVISQVFIIFVELFVVDSLFTKFNLLGEYNIYQIMLCFSLVWFGYSFSEMAFRGFDQFDYLIVRGKLDLLLLRPRNLFIQIMGVNVCYEKVGRAVLSLGLYIYSAIKLVKHITFLKVVLLILMPIGCNILFLSILIFGAALCFKTIQGLEVINIFTSGTKQLSEYPMDMYNKVVKRIFTFIIPLTLVNYYPVKYLIDETSNILYVFLPLCTIGLLIISLLVFNKAVRHYCSTGS